jgi:predicted RNA methylase
MTTSRIIIGSRRSAPVPSATGVTRSVPRRLPNEFYPTPPEATRALLSVETFEGSIWEPACGEGAIARELAAAGNTVVASDLVDYGFGISGVDFLKETRPRARHIVTNPPYGSGLADAFIEQALRFAHTTRGTVAMLLNLSSLSHRRRTSWWKEKPPARLYAIDDIVCWPVHLYGPAPSAFTRHRYVWAVWTPDHRGPSAF